MGEQQQVTAKDIARMCGVSTTTVSRVINQNGRYSEETERRVREAIKKYNYQPNLLAKGLRQKRSDAIGVIVPDISNEYFSSMILSMQRVFFEAGYSINIYNTNNSLEMERQCHAQLAAQSVSGIISVNSKEDVRDALERMVPTVYVDRFIQEGAVENVVSISSDNLRSGRLAAQELVACGCTHPVTITAAADSPVTTMRTQGFCEGLAECGIELTEDRIVAPETTGLEDGVARVVEVGIAQVEKLLGRGIEFDGLFCQTDWLAIGALEALHQHHITVPDEVAVVGHDDIMIARFSRLPLTTIHQDSLELGRRAAMLMLDMINGKPPESPLITLPVGLVRRETTRRR